MCGRTHEGVHSPTGAKCPHAASCGARRRFCAAAPVLDAARIGQRTICQPGARATVILAARSRNSIDSRRRRGTLMGVLGPDLTHDGEVRHAAVGNIGGGGSFYVADGGVRVHQEGGSANSAM